MSSSSRQMTIGDSLAKQTSGEVLPYGCKTGSNGLTVQEREVIRYNLRNVFLEHLFGAYRNVSVLKIADRKPAGFTVEVKQGYSSQSLTVCGISRAISDRIATEEGDRAIKNIYGSVPTAYKRPATWSKEEEAMIQWNSLSASDKGQRIHQLMYHTVECMPDCNIKGPLIYSEESIDDCGCLQKIHMGIWNKMEIKVWKRIESYLVNVMNLTPISSEFFLWDPRLKVATRVDLICLTAHMTFVVVSLKTGMFGRDGAPGNTLKHFRAPLEDLTDSIQNRHLLQLLLEVLLLTHQYSILLTDAFVLYVHLNEFASGAEGPIDTSEPRISIKRPVGIASKLNLTLPALLNTIYTMLEL